MQAHICALSLLLSACGGASPGAPDAGEQDASGGLSVAPPPGPFDAARDAGYDDAGIAPDATIDAAAECTTDNDCIQSGPCDAPVCADGMCLPAWVAPGTVARSGQSDGDCSAVLCGDQGELERAADPEDAPDDGDPCTIEACDGDEPTIAVASDGTECDGGECRSGECTACLANGSSCGESEECCGSLECVFGTCSEPGTECLSDEHCETSMACDDTRCWVDVRNTCADGRCWAECDETGCGVIKPCGRLEDCEGNGPLWYCHGSATCRRSDGGPWPP